MKLKLWSNDPLPRYNAKPIKKNGIGFLMDDFGNSAPSVTSILELTRTPEEKARLANWRKSKGSKANHILNIGRQGHRQIERFLNLNGENISCSPLLKPYWNKLRATLEELRDIRLVEGNVFHLYKGYAGRVDCVGRIYDLPQCLIEFKFADEVKPIHESTKLQVAAYIAALNRQYGPPYRVKITQGIVIVATPNEVDINLLNEVEVMKYLKEWEKRVADFWKMQRLAA
jgi:hypothetical protein